MTTQTFIGTLTVLPCATCSMPFGITEQFRQLRESDHASFYCPSGHGMSYRGKSPIECERDALQSRLKVSERSERFYREQAAAERRSAAAQKGHRTRVLNLIARGVCPVGGCRRNFTNVREHMATQHPDFHTHEDAR